MKACVSFLLTLGLSLTAEARPPFEPEVLADGILFWPSAAAGVSTVSLKGPGKLISRMDFAAGEVPFVDIHFVNGKPLPDGLYKYEIVAAPVAGPNLTASGKGKGRGNVDRNAFTGMTDPKVSPVSGTFRVVDGEVVDPYLDEVE
jgi:hypothetical protein